MAAGDKWQATVVAQLGGVSIANVLHVGIIDDTGIADEAAGVAAMVAEHFVDEMTPLQAAALEYECILTRRVQPQTSPSEVHPLTQIGVAAGTPLVASQAVVLSIYADKGERQDRGRTFLGGIPESFSNQGRILDGINNVFSGLVAKFTAASLTTATHTYKFQQYSRKSDTFRDIKNARIQPQLSKVRNRTPGICSIS